MQYAIGVDVGGMSIKAGIVDTDNRIVESKALPTLAAEGNGDGEKVANGIVKLMEELCQKVGIRMKELAGVGVCIPGSIDAEKGMVVYANNIDLHNLPLRELIRERTGITIAMGNDADVAAFGEYAAGSTAGCESSLMITLGTGVGGGFIKNGKIFSGFAGRGGEFGHMVVEADGYPCTCGRKGCLESYASATGLIRMTKEAMQKDPESGMWELVDGDLDRVDGKTAFDAMEKGDACAQQVVDTYIRYLGCGLANYINMLAPQRICLGGGISKSGEALLAPLRVETYKNVYGGADEKTAEIVQATLGNDAGIIGAAVLGRR